MWIRALVALALSLPAAARAEASRFLLATAGTTPAEAGQIRERLEAELGDQNGALLDPTATAAALRAFLPKGPLAASEDELRRLVEQAGVDRAIFVRPLPRGKGEALAVVQVRIVGREKVLTRLVSVEPGQLAEALARQIAELLPHQRIETAPDEPEPSAEETKTQI